MGCNIHDWMVAYIVVLDAAVFAQTDARGIIAAELARRAVYLLEYCLRSDPEIANRSGQSFAEFRAKLQPAVETPPDTEEEVIAKAVLFQHSRATDRDLLYLASTRTVAFSSWRRQGANARGIRPKSKATRVFIRFVTQTVEQQRRFSSLGDYAFASTLLNSETQTTRWREPSRIAFRTTAAGSVGFIHPAHFV